MTVLWMGLAVLVAAVPLTWWIDRKCAQYEREARLRAWLKRSPEAARIKRAIAQFAQQVNVALVPAMGRMVRAAADMEASMAKVNAAMAEGKGLADLQRLAEQMSKGGKR